MRLKCELIGHAWHPEGLCQGCWDCVRCGFFSYFGPEESAPDTFMGRVLNCINGEWLHRTWQLQGWWRNVVRRRVHCRDCGAWFGRHTDDCLPF